MLVYLPGGGAGWVINSQLEHGCFRSNCAVGRVVPQAYACLLLPTKRRGRDGILGTSYFLLNYIWSRTKQIIRACGLDRGRSAAGEFGKAGRPAAARVIGGSGNDR